MTAVTTTIPASPNPVTLTLEAGSTKVFIGANGAGKTRLGVFIENQLSKKGEAHRIAAHRSLVMNPNVMPPNFDVAMSQLRFGHDGNNKVYKQGGRWGNKPAIALLTDFDHVMKALYAEENSVSVKFRQAHSQNPQTSPVITKLDTLRTIWQDLLPHRELIVEASNVKTAPTGQAAQAYSASEMSDGERVIFYMLGQALLARPNTILIIDEPELHINKSVLAKLWDKIETQRKDCVLIYITHDIEFAASRHAAEKYVIRSYQKEPEQWDIELVPEDTDIPDDVVALIVGSRQPVLFVEGDGGSLDIALYRRVYDAFTVIPVGSCEQVIHTVATFAQRKELHRVGCAGIIDADGRSSEEISTLAAKSIHTLPVSEVENLLLLPDVFVELAKALLFDVSQAQAKLAALKAVVFAKVGSEVDRVSLDYTRRRLDAKAKKIGLASKTIADLEHEFRTATAAIDPTAIFQDMHGILTKAIADSDYETVLRHYDNKGLLAEAAKLLGLNQKSLEEFIGRVLRGRDQGALLLSLTNCLPVPVARS
jgi:ABC-type branched-subunit amino acid transport system ATPase component